MVISRAIIRVTPFRALITPLITYLLSPPAPSSEPPLRLYHPDRLKSSGGVLSKARLDQRLCEPRGHALGFRVQAVL